jgi:hypothetical protein
MRDPACHARCQRCFLSECRAGSARVSPRQGSPALRVRPLAISAGQGEREPANVGRWDSETVGTAEAAAGTCQRLRVVSPAATRTRLGRATDNGFKRPKVTFRPLALGNPLLQQGSNRTHRRASIVRACPGTVLLGCRAKTSLADGAGLSVWGEPGRCGNDHEGK